MRALDTRGYSMSSVRFICGTQDIHKELEKVVTDFLGTEDTILFPSCMDANAGVFEAILTKDDIMISDRLVHASIVDGMRLCSAERDTYKHGDMEHLEKKLQQFQDKRLRVIINDGVYSMDGDTAKLDEIVRRLREAGHEVFLPQEQETSVHTPDRNFRNDLAHLDWSEVLIGVVDGPDTDSGTAWEIGYAFATKHPIILLRTNFRGASHTGAWYNLMLAQSASKRIDLPIPTADQAAEVVLEALAKLEGRNPPRR